MDLELTIYKVHINEKKEMSPKIYRYMNEKYVDEFLNTGSIRIGTLYKYKDINCDIRKDSREAEVFTGRLIDGKDDSGTRVENIIHYISREYKNQFVLSYSKEHSTRLMNHFKTTSCLIINEPRKFHDAITKAIRNKYKLKSSTIDECIYFNPSAVDENLMKYYLNFPFLSKNISYIEEKEIRSIWILQDTCEPEYFQIDRYAKWLYKPEIKSNITSEEWEIVLKCEVNIGEHQEFICEEAIKYCNKSSLTQNTSNE